MNQNLNSLPIRRQPCHSHGFQLAVDEGAFLLPMKTRQEYEQEIAALKELIRKMQIQLTAALEWGAKNHRKGKP
jgi:hypothetical protein